MLEWWVVWYVKRQKEPRFLQTEQLDARGWEFPDLEKGHQGLGVRPFQSPLDMDHSLQDDALNSHGAFSGSSLSCAFFFSDNVPPQCGWWKTEWKLVCWNSPVCLSVCLPGLGGGGLCFFLQCHSFVKGSSLLPQKYSPPVCISTLCLLSIQENCKCGSPGQHFAWEEGLGWSLVTNLISTPKLAFA